MRTRTLASVALAAVLLAACADDGAETDTGTQDDAAASDDSTEEAVEDPADEADDAGADGDEDGADAGDDGAGDGADEAAGTTVSIVDFGFEPETLTVAVGDTVTWTHDGNITHNVTARDGDFASESMASGDSFSHTFTEAGEFAYTCTLHGQMSATVVVE